MLAMALSGNPWLGFPVLPFLNRDERKYLQDRLFDFLHHRDSVAIRRLRGLTATLDDLRQRLALGPAEPEADKLRGDLAYVLTRLALVLEGQGNRERAVAILVQGRDDVLPASVVPTVHRIKTLMSLFMHQFKLLAGADDYPAAEQTLAEARARIDAIIRDNDDDRRYHAECCDTLRGKQLDLRAEHAIHLHAGGHCQEAMAMIQAILTEIDHWKDERPGPPPSLAHREFLACFTLGIMHREAGNDAEALTMYLRAHWALPLNAHDDDDRSCRLNCLTAICSRLKALGGRPGEFIRYSDMAFQHYRELRGRQFRAKHAGDIQAMVDERFRIILGRGIADFEANRPPPVHDQQFWLSVRCELLRLIEIGKASGMPRDRLRLLCDFCREISLDLPVELCREDFFTYRLRQWHERRQQARADKSP